MVYDNELITNSTRLISWCRKHRTLQRGERTEGESNVRECPVVFLGTRPILHIILKQLMLIFVVTQQHLFLCSSPSTWVTY